jgi:hypothetical protein
MLALYIGIGSENNGLGTHRKRENIYNILPENFQPIQLSLKTKALDQMIQEDWYEKETCKRIDGSAC